MFSRRFLMFFFSQSQAAIKHKTSLVDKEYAKDVNMKKEDVLELLRWIDDQEYLPKVTEFQAMTFLYSNYYDVEGAKKTVDSYYTLRTHHADALDPITNADTIKDTLSVVFMAVLPVRTSDGNIVVIVRLADTTPSRAFQTNITKLLDMMALKYLYKHGNCPGIVAVVDATGAALGHVFRVELNMLRHSISYLQTGFPMRLKQIHVINMSFIAAKLLNLAKPLLGQQILEMLYLHYGDNSTLYDYVAREIIPVELGGCGQTIERLTVGNYESFVDSIDLFRWLRGQKVDENKRQQI